MAPIGRTGWEVVVAQKGCYVVAKLRGGKVQDVHAAHLVKDLPEDSRTVAEQAYQRGTRRGRHL